MQFTFSGNDSDLNTNNTHNVIDQLASPYSGNHPAWKGSQTSLTVEQIIQYRLPILSVEIL